MRSSYIECRMIGALRWLIAAVMAVQLGFMPTACFAYNGDANGYEGQPFQDPLVIILRQDSIVAYKSGVLPLEIDLLPGELAREMRTSGLVGGVVTSDRMLAISSESFQWFAMPLEVGEDAGNIYLSANLVLFTTQDRGIAFDPALNGFITFEVPLGENITAQMVEPDIAVLTTMERAVGYAAGSGIFTEMSFAPGEIFQDLAATSDLISVITSNRVLLFQSASGQWTERVLPLAE